MNLHFKQIASKQWAFNFKSYILFNPFMPSGLFCVNSLDQSISSLTGVWLDLIITMFYWNACS